MCLSGSAGQLLALAFSSHQNQSVERSCDGLLLDIGVVFFKSVWEMADDFERLENLPPRTFPGRGPFDDESGEFVDEGWAAYRRGDITEREYWLTTCQIAVDRGAPLNGHPQLMRAMAQRDGIEVVRPEGLALLKQAHDAGLRTGILSNELMDFQGREWVEAQEWFGWFDIVVDSSELGARKPRPEPYVAAIELMGLPADRQVFIDDNPSYVAAGEDAGLNSILLDVLEPWVAYDRAAVLLGLKPFGRLN